MTDRDRLAKAKGIDPTWLTTYEVEAYRLGVAAERKRCVSRVAEEIAVLRANGWADSLLMVSDRIVKTIERSEDA